MHAVPHKQRRSFRARNLSPRWMASHLQQWDEGANAIVAPCSNIPGPDGCLSDPKASRTIQMRWSRKPNKCSKVSLLKASRMTVSNRRQVPQKAYPLLTAKGPKAVCLLVVRFSPQQTLRRVLTSLVRARSNSLHQAGFRHMSIGWFGALAHPQPELSLIDGSS